MKFIVKIKSLLDDNYEMPGLTVRIGKANEENPDLELWRPLVLRPDEMYVWQTDDPKHEYAPFSEITLKSGLSKIPFRGDSKRKLVEVVQIEVKKRKDWDSKYCPWRDFKYTCVFHNKTETIWSYFGEKIGSISVRPGIPKRIPLSVLSPLCRWTEISIKYARSIDNETGRIFPRIAKWFGTKERSKKELQELELDIEKTLKKYHLTPETLTPGMAIESELRK